MGLSTIAETLPLRPRASTLGRSPIDHPHLARYTLGNRELEREVLELFAGQAPQTMAWLVSATTPKAWRDAAHTLKGSARAVGAWQVAAAAEHAESVPHMSDDEARQAAIEVINEALATVCTYIATLTVAA